MGLTEEERDRKCSKQRGVYKANAEQMRAKSKAWREANKESRHLTQKKYREKHKDKIKEYAAITKEERASYQAVYQSKEVNRVKKRVYSGIWQKNNRDKCSAAARKQSARLNDGYVAGLIAKRTNLSNMDVPQSLIKAKRAYIKGMRLIKEQEDER
jgi:hypothetical protein